MELFLSKYKKHLNNSFELGYYIHLLTDKIWFEDFVSKIYYNTSIKMKDGSILNVESDFIMKIIYEDYTNLNVDLIDKYGLDLSIFYEENDLKKTFIKEYPIDRVNLLLTKMGVIIENSKQGKTYSLDLNAIEKFINNTSDIIVNKIINSDYD